MVCVDGIRPCPAHAPARAELRGYAGRIGGDRLGEDIVAADGKIAAVPLRKVVRRIIGVGVRAPVLGNIKDDGDDPAVLRGVDVEAPRNAHIAEVDASDLGGAAVTGQDVAVVEKVERKIGVTIGDVARLAALRAPGVGGAERGERARKRARGRDGERDRDDGNLHIVANKSLPHNFLFCKNVGMPLCRLRQKSPQNDKRDAHSTSIAGASLDLSCLSESGIT